MQALAGVPMIRAHSHPPPHPSAPRRSSASCNHESTTKKKSSASHEAVRVVRVGGGARGGAALVAAGRVHRHGGRCRRENEVWEGPPLVLAVLQLKTNRYAVQINVAEKRKREEVWRRVPISRCETQLSFDEGHKVISTEAGWFAFLFNCFFSLQLSHQSLLIPPIKIF
uniref:Uncharacterized protein n=1 Tax=Oryza barthii TaxID=65489 RepID=A0A0D3EMB3_9ORYZ